MTGASIRISGTVASVGDASTSGTLASSTSLTIGSAAASTVVEGVTSSALRKRGGRVLNGGLLLASEAFGGKTVFGGTIGVSSAGTDFFSSRAGRPLLTASGVEEDGSCCASPFCKRGGLPLAIDEGCVSAALNSPSIVPVFCKRCGRPGGGELGLGEQLGSLPLMSGAQKALWADRQPSGMTTSVRKVATMDPNSRETAIP